MVASTTELDRLIQHPPNLHFDRKFNGLTSWGIQPSFLQSLAKLIVPDSLTLETGSGLSTICFAILGCKHICISPDADEHQRIRRYCEDRQIPMERLRFIVERSNANLPTLDLDGRQLDFALIDGAHAFPQPVIDYFYINERLKVGGLLAVDDLTISSVGMLHVFLRTEDAYELVSIDSMKTALYRKVRATEYPRDWKSQNMNRRYPDFSFLPLVRRVRRAARQVPGLQRIYSLLKH
jgi:predicted O-methyltransferase YrrM